MPGSLRRTPAVVAAMDSNLAPTTLGGAQSQANNMSADEDSKVIQNSAIPIRTDDADDR